MGFREVTPDDLAEMTKGSSAVIHVIPDVESAVGLRLIVEVNDKEHEPTARLVGTIHQMLARAAQMTVEGAMEQAAEHTKQ